MPERTPWMVIVEKIQQHPYWAAAGLAFTTIGAAATIWSWFDDRPLFKVLWDARGALMDAQLWAGLGLLLIVASLVLLFGMAVAIAHGTAKVAGLEGQCRSSREAVRRTTEERDEAQTELAGAHRALSEGQRKWATEQIQLFSQVLINGEKPRVTVRFATYSDTDFMIASSIEQTLKDLTSWQVGMDNSNNPVLRPDSNFKVVFDLGPAPLAFSRIVNAFNDGNFIDVPVGCRHSDRTDHHHLIVEVLPTPGR